MQNVHFEGESCTRGSFGVPLGGTRRVGGLLGVAGRLSGLSAQHQGHLTGGQLKLQGITVEGRPHPRGSSRISS